MLPPVQTLVATLIFAPCRGQKCKRISGESPPERKVNRKRISGEFLLDESPASHHSKEYTAHKTTTPTPAFLIQLYPPFPVAVPGIFLADKQLRHLPTAATRSGRFFCHRQRSHRSPRGKALRGESPPERKVNRKRIDRDALYREIATVAMYVIYRRQTTSHIPNYTVA